MPVEAELAPEQDWQFSFLPQQLAGALVASLVEPGWQGYHFVDTGEAACISADGCFAIDERGGVRLTRVGADADPQTLLARRYLIGAEDQAGGRHLAQLQFAPAATEPNLGLAYVDSDGGDLSLHTLLCPGKLVAAGVAYQAEQQLPHAYHTTAVGLDLPALDANVF
ncbi:MAG: hypothetical protein OIF35_04440 [Cellvibrionaceae bacterium]|nr:hypothetical protein [Cellvibrionaceae bacterium]